jgi:hypothetical protein
MPERIGSDVLGSSEPPRMSPKKRKELEEKVKEELAKKKAEERPIEELPKEGVPGEVPHEATPEERAEILDKEQKKKRKTVHVREHYRSRPSNSMGKLKAEEV